MKLILPVPLTLITLMFVLNTACTQQERETQQTGFPEAQLVFWENIQQHCGNAYRGVVGDATPFYGAIADAELIRIHVRECTDSLTHISLHVDDNHSRNLLLTKADGTLRLKHDHRYPDGTEEEITQYGGDAPKPGLETRQIFWADDHTESILPDRYDNFWFLDIMDAETLAYGVHWPEHGHSIRLEFDISTPVSAPPAPWGYDE